MNQLKDLPNISKVITEKLSEAGIDSPDMLRILGSREAFLRIREKDDSACINMLYALEGALQGIRWHHLPDEDKLELKTFFRKIK